MTDGIRPETSQKSGAGPGRVLGLVPDVVASFLLGVMVLLTCADVIGRELFNSPVPGAVDLTRMLLVVLVLSVLPLVSFREEHISVDLIDAVYPDRFVAVRQAVINLAGSIFLAAMARQVHLLAIQDEVRNRVYDDLRISIAPVTYFVSAMIAVTALVLLVNALRHIVHQFKQPVDNRSEGQRKGKGL